MSEAQIRKRRLHMPKTETKKARRRQPQTMCKEAEKHLRKIKRQVAANLEHKYRLGHAEHGGNLLRMTPLKLIDEAIQEATDQLVFLLTAKNELEGEL